MSSKTSVGKAASLLLFRKGWGGIINIGVLAILARHLNKEDFGLVAISSVLISFISIVASTGIGEYLIYYRGENEKEVKNKAFGLNVIITLIVTLVVLIVIPFWSKFYNDERIKFLAYLLLVNFIGEMIAIVPKALLRKEFKYGVLVKYLTIFGTLTSMAKVLFVFLGFGVYSLVLPMAIFSPILAFSLIIQSPLSLDFKIGGKLLNEIAKYVKHIIGSNVLTYLVNEGDTLIVGKVLGLEALGVYNIAFNVSNIFQSTLLPIITDISLPSFAKISDDIASLRLQYLKMINFIAFFSFPLLSIMIVHSRAIINILYGNKWNSAILPLMILLVFTIMRSISSPTSSLFNSTGNPKIGFVFSLYFAPLFLLSIFLGSYWGIIGICLAVTISRVLGAQILISKSLDLIGYRLSLLYKEILPIIIVSLIIIISNIFIYLILDYNLYLDLIIATSQLVSVGVILRIFFKSYLEKIIVDIISIAPKFKIINKILLLNA